MNETQTVWIVFIGSDEDRKIFRVYDSQVLAIKELEAGERYGIELACEPYDVYTEF